MPVERSVRHFHKPKSLIQLHTLADNLQNHITRQINRIEKVRAFSPGNPEDIIDKGKESFAADAAEATVKNWLNPRLEFVLEEIDNRTRQAKFEGLQKRAQKTSAFSGIPVETILAPARIEFFAIQSEDRAETTPVQVIHNGRIYYRLNLPDAQEILVAGQHAPEVARHLINAAIKNTPVTLKELALQTLGKDDANSTDAINTTIAKVLRPVFKKKGWLISQLTTFSELAKGVPSRYLPEKEILTQDIVVLLARLIMNLNNTDIMHDGQNILTIQINPDILNTSQRVNRLKTDNNYANLPDEQKLEIRRQILSELNIIMCDSKLFNKALSSQSRDVKILLRWLEAENQTTYNGTLTLLLEQAGTLSSISNNRSLEVLSTRRSLKVDLATADKLRAKGDE